MVNKRTILKAKYLWDGVAAKPLPDGAVLIEDGIIKGVGTASEIVSAADANIVDVGDATLLPGLIDSHTHLSMDGSLPDYLDLMADNVDTLKSRAIEMMKRDLAAGVTTCRCLGDKEFLDVAIREAVERCDVDGPRLLVATRGIRSPEGHGFVGYPFKGVQAIRRAISENIAQGADLIKIYITGTLKGNGELPSYLTGEEIRTAIEYSHSEGKRVASHCVGGQGLDWALEYNLDTLEHAYHITMSQVQELARSRTALVLTPGAVLSEARVRRLPKRLIPGHLEERDQMFMSMSFTVQAKIPFAVGTDGMHGHLAEDIRYLSELGASAYEALRAATISGARICGIDGETGSLQKGKWADIIAVQGNPFKNLNALDNVVAVMKQGRMVKENLKVPYAYGK